MAKKTAAPPKVKKARAVTGPRRIKALRVAVVQTDADNPRSPWVVVLLDNRNEPQLTSRTYQTEGYARNFAERFLAWLQDPAYLQ